MMDSVRAASIADVARIADVDVETWHATYAGILPDKFLVGLSRQSRSAAWARFLARRPGDLLVASRPDGAVIGFGSCGPQRDPAFVQQGEIFTLYVHPDHQGQQWGRHLLLGLFARLIRVGHNSALVWVVRENPSRFFYERLGASMIGNKHVRMGSSGLVETLGYVWPDLREALHEGAKAKSRIADDSPSP